MGLYTCIKIRFQVQWKQYKEVSYLRSQGAISLNFNFTREIKENAEDKCMTLSKMPTDFSFK